MKILRFGMKVDLLRRAKDLTYGELSAKSGIPERTLARLCEGRSAPCAAHFIRLMRALGASISVFEPEDFEEGGL